MKTTFKYVATCLLLSTMAVATITTTGCTHQKQYRRSSGEYLDDQTVTARVKSALFADPNAWRETTVAEAAAFTPPAWPEARRIARA